MVAAAAAGELALASVQAAEAPAEYLEAVAPARADLAQAAEAARELRACLAAYGKVAAAAEAPAEA